MSTTHQPATPAQLWIAPNSNTIGVDAAAADTACCSVMSVAGLDYKVTKGGLARLNQHIRLIESWIRHYASDRRLLRKQRFISSANELTAELRRLFAERRAMRAGAAVLVSAIS